MKKWLTDSFLPMWAKETVLRDNRSLSAENGRLKQKIKELEAYIQGLQTASRLLNRLRIYGKGGSE